MKGDKVHHAFRVVYNGIARQLLTECAIALPSATNPLPKKDFHKFKAIWDTGATNSVITENVVKKISLAPTGKINSYGVHGQSEVNTYILDIGLPNHVCIQNVRVSEAKLMGDIDVLIGMDIIQAGDFAICNPDMKTIFSYCMPSHKNPIDLLEKSDKVNKSNHCVPTPIIATSTK